MQLTRSNQVTNEIAERCLYPFVTLINGSSREQKPENDGHSLHLLVIACNKRLPLYAKYRKEQIGVQLSTRVFKIVEH